MRQHLGTCLLLAQLALVVPAASANEVDDVDAWVSEVGGMIERGELTGLYDVIIAAVPAQSRENFEQARNAIEPIVRYAGERRPAYVDGVQDVRHGTTFRRVILSAWYPGLDFIFYSFDFFRLEKGWALNRFNFDTNFNNIMTEPLSNP